MFGDTNFIFSKCERDAFLETFGIGVPSPCGQDIVGDVLLDFSLQCCAGVVFDVHRVVVGRIKVTDLVDHRPPHEAGTGLGKDVGMGPIPRRQHFPLAGHTGGLQNPILDALAEHTAASRKPFGLGVIGEELCDRIERPGFEQVIAVQISPNISGGPAKPLVDRIGLAVVWLGHPPGNLRLELANHIDRPIRAATVDDDQLDVIGGR